MEEEQGKENKFDLDAFLFALIVVMAVAAACLGLGYMIEHAGDETGHPIGEVESVDTFEGNLVEEVEIGDTTAQIVYSTKDRCRIKFKDGRVKVLIGMPSEAIPVGQNIAVFWKHRSTFLGWEDAEEHRLRHRKQEQGSTQ